MYTFDLLFSQIHSQLKCCFGKLRLYKTEHFRGAAEMILWEYCNKTTAQEKGIKCAVFPDESEFKYEKCLKHEKVVKTCQCIDLPFACR